MFDPLMSSLAIILRQSSVGIGLLPATGNVSEKARAASSQIKGYWEAEMNSSKKNMEGQGETKDIIKSESTLHCNDLTFVVTYDIDTSHGFARKESVTDTTSKRDDTECYHSYKSKDDVKCSVEVHLSDGSVDTLADCLIHRQQLIKTLEAW